MNNSLYDVVIIGGGPAGSTTASKLVTLGHRVLVLEKEKFPREHVGESLLPFCYQMFQELGVLEEMEEKFSRKPGVTFSNIDGSSASNWCFHDVIKDPSYLSFHVHRAKFDQVLLENSKKKGAEVREEIKVIHIDFEAGTDYSVVKAVDKDGQELEFSTRFVVDASGQATLLAKQLDCKRPFTSMTQRVAYSSHWVDAKLDPALMTGNIKIVHLEGDKLGWLWMIPIYDNRLSIGVSVNMSYAKKRRKEISKENKDWIKQFYIEEILSSPIAAKVVKGAKIAQPIAANSDFSYYAEKKYSDRYAIVGDASAFLDPVFSSGIYLGMKSGLMVGEGISQWLNKGETTLIDKAYEDIAGAYRLVEKLVNTFYEPGSIRFSGADKAFDQSYNKFETAYSILHLLLAGDFFTNSDKYIKAIEMLRDPAMIEKYRNLIKHPGADQSTNNQKACGQPSSSGS